MLEICFKDIDFNKFLSKNLAFSSDDIGAFIYILKRHNKFVDFKGANNLLKKEQICNTLSSLQGLPSLKDELIELSLESNLSYVLDFKDGCEQAPF